MSYIGRSPQIGGYHKLDAITTDGSASYTMQLNSGNFVPESANHLIVSVNGVIQAPTDSFTVSGSTITFASTLSVSDTIDFIMALGNTLDIGVPSDSTVSLSKLTATGTKDATTFLRGDNTFAVPAGGENTPAFHAYGSGSNLTVPDSVATKVNIFNTEIVDTDNCFASSRFTPTTAGKYFVYANMYWDTGTVNDYHNGAVSLRKNGSNYAQIDNNWNASGGNAMSNHVGAIMDMNGSTDYVEVYVYQNTGSGASVTVYAQSNITQFGAFKLIGV